MSNAIIPEPTAPVTHPVTDGRIYTIKELAARLRITTTAVYRNLKQWEHLRFGTEIRFTEAQYQAVLAKATRAPARPAPRAPYGSRTGRQS